MRLPRVRFTVRRLMILVAMAAAAILMADSLRRLSIEYDEKADRNRSHANLALRGYPGDAPHQLRRAAHFVRLADKFEHAARYPWLPVAPDSPTQD